MSKVIFNLPTFEKNSFNSSQQKEKRCLMATDIIRELKKLVAINGDKKVFVSTGSECCDAREVSCYEDGIIRIGW